MFQTTNQPWYSQRAPRVLGLLHSARLLDAAGPVADLDPIRFDLGVEALEAVRLPFVHEHRDDRDDRDAIERWVDDMIM